MKLLVIGATGQVARSLLEKSSEAVSETLALEAPELDLTDVSSIDRAMHDVAPDIVVNAAAYTAVDKAEEDVELAFAINRDGPAHLASACARSDIPLIHISTDYVFDGTVDRAYTEDDPAAPLGVYGLSKHEGDQAVARAASKHIILRTAWVYSPFGNNFVKTMLRLARTRNDLNVVDDQYGCPSYAPHIADGILRVIEKIAQDSFEQEPWGVYNMAGGSDTTWYGFAREIFVQSAKLKGPVAKIRPITTAQYPTPARRPANSRLDCSKLTRVFGVTLPDWRDGTADCVIRLLQDTNQTGIVS